MLLTILVVCQYLVSLRVSFLALLFLLLFPFLAFTKLRQLFREFFDQTPLSLFAVTLSAYALAGTIARTAWLVVVDGPHGLRTSIPTQTWAKELLRLDNPHASLNWLGALGISCLPMIVESGFRLLLGTTSLSSALAPNARESAQQLHTINGSQYDVAARTAARLSATFPLVTPAAKANKGKCMPHMVDGGYYDDYGMATLVEWLDQALLSSKGRIQNVLVLEIHCSPVIKQAQKNTKSSRGWLFQLVAPLLAVLHVRSAGQIAHNDIEFNLLQDRWRPQTNIQRVTFEFDGENAPLSWHLTKKERQEIEDKWRNTMQANAAKVHAAL